MEAPALTGRVYRFGLFHLNPDGGKLLRQGVPVKIQEQPLRVLCLLLEHPSEVVTREELRQSLWPEGTYVEFDGSLNATLTKLRFALGDDADNPIFIETVPRRGYRFIAPVEVEQSTDTNVPDPSIPKSPELGTGNIPSSASSSRKWLLWMLPTLGLLLAIGWRYEISSRPSPAAARKVIAVLPFSNEGGGADFDYLRYAIANDLVTDLTYSRVAVRPFASTSRYASQPSDPEAVGKELRVTHVVAGGFLLDKDKKNLRVNLELVDVAQNQAIWRKEISVSSHGHVALHDKLATEAAMGLLTALNVSNASPSDTPAPKSEKALDLFLHSLTIPLDPEPNLLAIKKLEESVSLDSGYAPSWRELGWRYYIDYHYGNGGDAAVARALQAYKRQSELDPNWPPVATPIRVEQGDLNGAYDQAADFLRRRPDVSWAHYSMSYVLRYAGLLDEAGKQCDAALAIDPGYNMFRSCANPFILMGDYEHAQRYIRLDENSGVGALLRMMIALRTGNTTATLKESNTVASQTVYRLADLVQAYLRHAPEKELSEAAARIVADTNTSRDAEEVYRNAEVLSLCRQTDLALMQLRNAIQGNYCSYPAIDKDPLFDSIRQTSQFVELRQASIQCQQNFLAHRRQVDATFTVSK